MKTDLKTKRFYDIFVEWSGEKRGFLDIRGYRVIIPGFEEYELFVHRNHIEDDGLWRMSEASTGFGFPDGCNAPTRRETIENVATLLNKKGKPKLQKVIVKAKEFVTNPLTKEVGR